jgi:hypothetical protein
VTVVGVVGGGGVGEGAGVGVPAVVLGSRRTLVEVFDGCVGVAGAARAT